MTDTDTDWEADDSLEKDLGPAENKKPADDEDFSDFLDIVEDDDDEDKGGGIQDDEPEEEEELEKGDNRYQKRIDRLVADRGTAERASQAQAIENQELRERLERLESGQTDNKVQNFKHRYQAVRNALHTAHEEGDSTRAVELTEQMADMRAAARVADAQRQAAVMRRQQEQAYMGAAGEEAPPQLAMEWWNKRRWFNTPEHAGESAYARQVDIQLEREGFDKFYPEYYDELDRRLQARFPELYSDSTKKAKGKKRASSPSAPTRGQRRKSSKFSNDGRIRMTRGELEVAKSLGLTSKEALKEYEKELRISRANQEA
jgi:hypothetical protein|tara:strand:- start:7055 stop:8005 length:951 start_codon:yes stop_codon:yes gene_type:complete